MPLAANLRPVLDGFVKWVKAIRDGDTNTIISGICIVLVFLALNALFGVGTIAGSDERQAPLAFLDGLPEA